MILQMFYLQHLLNHHISIIIRGLSDIYDSNLPNDKILKVDQKLQIEFQRLSRKSKFRIAENSRHYIQNDEPEIIIEEIKKILFSSII